VISRYEKGRLLFAKSSAGVKSDLA